MPLNIEVGSSPAANGVLSSRQCNSSLLDIAMHADERSGSKGGHAEEILIQNGDSQFSTIAQISGIDIKAS
jgi:hypothetical protein